MILFTPQKHKFLQFLPIKVQISTSLSEKKGEFFTIFVKKYSFFEEFSPMQIVPHTQHLDPDQSPILFVCYVNYITIP